MNLEGSLYPVLTFSIFYFITLRNDILHCDYVSSKGKNDEKKKPEDDTNTHLSSDPDFYALSLVKVSKKRRRQNLGSCDSILNTANQARGI